MAGRERRAQVVWTRSADRDLARIYDYLRLESPSRAATMVTRVLGAAERLDVEPKLGAAAEDVEPVGRCRHLVVAPLRVIYRVGEGGVQILRVWDSRRDPGALHAPGGTGPEE